MSKYNIGDRVHWTRACAQPQFKNAEGTIKAVIGSDTNVEELTMYDVEFDFGLFTLYGSQLMEPSISPLK